MDKIIRCITSNGSIMAAGIDSTYLVATAQQIHKTSSVATAALGRLLTGTSVMGSMLKKANATITLKVNGGGPLGSLIAISDSNGYCKGCIDNPEVELPPTSNGKLDVGGAVGKDGLLGVIRDFGEGQPYMGQVELVSGEIAEDITSYYTRSEQIPTVCSLGVLVDKTDIRQILAGGLLIQVLPGAEKSDIDLLEKNAYELEPITKMLAKGMSIEKICETAFKGFKMEILDEYKVGYACNCSKEKVKCAISTLPPKQILTLADEKGFAEANCKYCNKVYKLSKQELKMLAKEAELKKK